MFKQVEKESYDLPIVHVWSRRQMARTGHRTDCFLFITVVMT